MPTMIGNVIERNAVRAMLEGRLDKARAELANATDGVHRMAIKARVDELLDLYAAIVGVRKE